MHHGWDEENLRERLAASLQVAARAVTLLAPAGYEAETQEGLRPEKVRAETALFLLASHAVCAADPDLAARHRQVAEALVPYARSERVAAMIALEPVVALDHALIHLCLSRLGLGDERFDRLLAAARTSRAAAARERLPHRDMEQAWLGRLTGAAGEESGRGRGLPGRSILGRPLDALSATADDVYAFTHAVLFATDLGARTPRLPRSGAAIAADAEAALAWCLDDQDYDLGGEVLLTWPLLRRRWSAAATFGFHCLARVEDEAGFLPAPVISLERLATLAGEARARYALALSYHTVYVMGLLCSLALLPGGAPPRSIPPARRQCGAAAALLEVPDADAEPRHWQGVFAALDAAQRDALAPLLLAIRLRRAAARRDLAGIQELLRAAARFDLLAAPAPQQAIELLQRAALLGRLGLATD
ncbi:MAG TPA: hypothetical protein VNJ70_15380 [Thermoanaerobaculia bacterium]|nr:hypothetical protein [Thermoanaerobaculia bacterium]